MDAVVWALTELMLGDENGAYLDYMTALIERETAEDEKAE
jgi:hypothetical protein